MELGYRKIIENIELTREEAETLYKAEEILREALRYIDDSNCDCNAFLTRTLTNSVEALEECNCKLNVHIIVEDDE